MVTVLTLPAVEGQILARSLDVSWPQMTVRGVDVAAFTRGEQGVFTWRSADGGVSWRVERT